MSDTLAITSVKSNNWSGSLPILLACVLRCDAPHCINNHEDQAGYIDPTGGILYPKKGLTWNRMGDKLACSLDCQNQLQDPSGGEKKKKG